MREAVLLFLCILVIDELLLYLLELGDGILRYEIGAAYETSCDDKKVGMRGEIARRLPPPARHVDKRVKLDVVEGRLVSRSGASWMVASERYR